MRKRKVRGYYVCLCGTDFMKPAPIKKQKCPCCGEYASLLTTVDETEEENIENRFKEREYLSKFSDEELLEMTNNGLLEIGYC